MHRVLITGAGRGLGLELTRQTLARGDRVFAGARNLENAAALQELKAAHPDQLTLLTLDVVDSSSIESAYQLVSQQVTGLDLLINNAGVNAKSKGMGDFGSHFTLGKLDADNMLEMFRINAVAPVLVAQRFLSLLRDGAHPNIVNISSWLGSIGGRKEGGNYSYSASKAALNMLTRILAFDVIQFGIVAVVINPGWVQTDMGGPHAELTPAESAQRVLQVIDGLREGDSGGFFSWNGESCPW